MHVVLDSNGNRVKHTTIGTNGRIHYTPVKGTEKHKEESAFERSEQERYWRSLGKKVRKNARIK